VLRSTRNTRSQLVNFHEDDVTQYVIQTAQQSKTNGFWTLNWFSTTALCEPHTSLFRHGDR